MRFRGISADQEELLLMAESHLWNRTYAIVLVAQILILNLLRALSLQGCDRHISGH